MEREMRFSIIPLSPLHHVDLGGAGIGLQEVIEHKCRRASRFNIFGPKSTKHNPT